MIGSDRQPGAVIGLAAVLLINSTLAVQGGEPLVVARRVADHYIAGRKSSIRKA